MPYGSALCERALVCRPTLDRPLFITKQHAGTLGLLGVKLYVGQSKQVHPLGRLGRVGPFQRCVAMFTGSLESLSLSHSRHNWVHFKHFPYVFRWNRKRGATRRKVLGRVQTVQTRAKHVEPQRGSKRTVCTVFVLPRTTFQYWTPRLGEKNPIPAPEFLTGQSAFRPTNPDNALQARATESPNSQPTRSGPFKV